MKQINISIILTAHTEGMIAGVSARSAQAALLQASKAGLTHETIVVLDRADAVTADTLRSAFGDSAQILESDEGDPGAARNHGIAFAKGDCATFLDCDDLWSDNWLVEAWRLIERRSDAVGHSACDLTFGSRRLLWWHLDSESALFDPEYLEWNNYWDALSFARTDAYRRFPFRRNDLKIGFGHEDWHWNTWTLAQGIPHKPVPRTMHFKRVRTGSQSSKVEAVNGFRWPLNIRGLSVPGEMSKLWGHDASQDQVR